MKKGTIVLIIVALSITLAFVIGGCNIKRLVGNDSDEHGCRASAGYTWCDVKQKCIRPFEENCTSQMVGNDVDEHGCRASAGYAWCDAKQKCIRSFEENCTAEPMLGGDRDSHGCIGSAGYSWCEPKQKCLRTWEESCGNMTLAQAVNSAKNSECTENGNLTNTSSYNPNSKTWWINLEMKPEFAKDGCNPACVIYENGTAEINWRCTGLLH